MPGRFAAWLVRAVAAVLALAPAAGAQTLIPGQMHTSFSFRLHSVKDKVFVYEGDPQFLLKTLLQPANTMAPRVDFSNTAQSVVLSIRDLSLLEPAVIDSIQEAEDAALGITHDAPVRPPSSQVWELQLAPACPGEYLLQCDGGKGVFDFTDLPVQDAFILADTTEVEVEFKRPNPTPCERFKLTVRSGSVDISRFLNSRSKTATFQIDDSDCHIDLTGKPFDGETDVFFEGVPKKLKVVVPAKAAVHVEGPAAVVTRFDRKGMQIAGSGLQTAGFETAPCRIRMHFNRAMPKFSVEWSD